MVLKPFVGLLSDRWGRRAWLIVGTALFTGMPFLYRFVETPEQLVALRIAHGLATAIYGPVTLAYVRVALFGAACGAVGVVQRGAKRRLRRRACGGRLDAANDGPGRGVHGYRCAEQPGVPPCGAAAEFARRRTRRSEPAAAARAGCPASGRQVFRSLAGRRARCRNQRRTLCGQGFSATLRSVHRRQHSHGGRLFRGAGGGPHPAQSYRRPPRRQGRVQASPDRRHGGAWNRSHVTDVCQFRAWS